MGNQKWLEPSKLLENLPVEKLPESNWLPKLPENPPQPPAVSRNPIDFDPGPLPCEKSEGIKSLPNYWSEKLLKISRPTCDSNLLLSWLSKKLLKLTWSVCSKTPTCVLSTPSELPSCPRTSNWPDESVVNELKFFKFFYKFKKLPK